MWSNESIAAEYRRGYLEKLAGWSSSVLARWPGMARPDRLRILDMLAGHNIDAFKSVVKGDKIIARSPSMLDASPGPALIQLARENPEALTAKNLRRLIMMTRRVGQDVNTRTVSPRRTYVAALDSARPSEGAPADLQAAFRARRMIQDYPDLGRKQTLSAEVAARPPRTQGDLMGQNIGGLDMARNIRTGRGTASEGPMDAVWWNRYEPQAGKSVDELIDPDIQYDGLHLKGILGRYGSGAMHHGDVPAISTAKIDNALIRGYGGHQGVVDPAYAEQILAGGPAVSEVRSTALPSAAMNMYGVQPGHILARHKGMSYKDPRYFKLQNKLDKIMSRNYSHPGGPLQAAVDDIKRRTALPHLNESLHGLNT